MRRHLALVVVGTIVAACSSSSPTTSTPSARATERPAASAASTPESSSGPTAAATHKPVCPNHDGGTGNVCLGPLAAGTYTTEAFQPPLTYTVGEGWGNYEDLPGNFLLIPPGSSLVGVNPGTSDYLGVYASVGASADCSSLRDDSVQGFDAYIAWLKARPGLKISNLEDASVGGLDGVRMDLIAKPGGDKCANDPDFADVYVGLPPSELDHGVTTTYQLRVWFLHQASRVLAIEIADAPNGGSNDGDWFSAATDVVNEFVFNRP